MLEQEKERQSVCGSVSGYKHCVNVHLPRALCNNGHWYDNSFQYILTEPHSCFSQHSRLLLKLLFVIYIVNDAENNQILFTVLVLLSCFHIVLVEAHKPWNVQMFKIIFVRKKGPECCLFKLINIWNFHLKLLFQDCPSIKNFLSFNLYTFVYTDWLINMG